MSQYAPYLGPAAGAAAAPAPAAAASRSPYAAAPYPYSGGAQQPPPQQYSQQPQYSQQYSQQQQYSQPQQYSQQQQQQFAQQQLAQQQQQQKMMQEQQLAQQQRAHQQLALQLQQHQQQQQQQQQQPQQSMVGAPATGGRKRLLDDVDVSGPVPNVHRTFEEPLASDDRTFIAGVIPGSGVASLPAPTGAGPGLGTQLQLQQQEQQQQQAGAPPAEAGSWRSVFFVDHPNDLRPGERGASYFRPAPLTRAFAFGRQQKRVDTVAPRELSPTAPAEFQFKIPRDFELLNDAQLVLELPDIWSTVMPPDSATNGNRWAAFEFRWIDELGAQIVQEVRVTAGNQQLARFSGDYLATVAKRDLDADRYAAFRAMTGDEPELTDPAQAHGRGGCYPSAFRQATTPAAGGAQPSVPARTLRVPLLAAWFTAGSQAALPLVCLSEKIDLVIAVTLRPLQDWFRVRDVLDPANDFPLCRPDFNQPIFQLHRFLQSPPAADVSAQNVYVDRTNFWNADVRLEVTGTYLTEYERLRLAAEPQRYLVREVREHRLDNVFGSGVLRLESVGGMVASWTWHLSRSDAAARNEWANHSNWPYLGRPPVPPAPAPTGVGAGGSLLPGSNPDGSSTGIFLSGDAAPQNRRHILATAAVLFDGKNLETDFPTSTWNQATRWVAGRGARDASLFAYSFALDPATFAGAGAGGSADKFSGGRDTSRVRRVELQLAVFPPPPNTTRAVNSVICDNDGNVLSVSGQPGSQFQYTYNLVLYEERYNFVEFAGGFAGLAVAS